MTAAEQAITLRQLQGELLSAEASIVDTQEMLTAMQRRQGGQQKRAANLRKEIAALLACATGPIVSEHALLRWLERVEGLDVEALRRHILSGTTEASINFAVNGEVMKDGHALVFKDRVIVTVK